MKFYQIIIAFLLSINICYAQKIANIVLTSKHNPSTLPQSKVTGKVLKQPTLKPGTTRFELINKSKTPATGIKLNLLNSKTFERIVPAYFTVRYFAFLPCESKVKYFDFNLPGNKVITTDRYIVTNTSIISTK